MAVERSMKPTRIPTKTQPERGVVLSVIWAPEDTLVWFAVSAVGEWASSAKLPVCVHDEQVVHDVAAVDGA